MCDTIAATPDATADRGTLFGKNSDRQRNEAQTVERLAGAKHGAGASVRCQYLTIPQAPQTHAVILCRPFWIWGAEMGANEHGVVIGNEAVHARRPAPKEPALTGNDLVRMALERAATAAEAAEVIIALLKGYGQGGNCGHLTPNYYNNSFLIADRGEIFVLETIERDWLLERVTGVRTISNRYSIGEPLRTSSSLDARLRECDGSDSTSSHYAERLADPHREHIGFAGVRRDRTGSLLRARLGRLGVSDFMTTLRDHGSIELGQSQWHPSESATCTVCMHAGGEERPGQTAGAMVSELTRDSSVHWVTGTAAPCLSVFKPILVEVPIPTHGPRPTGRYDARTLWWRHEHLHRVALLGDVGGFLTSIAPERDALEQRFQAQIKSVVPGGTLADRERVVSECWMEALETEEHWLSRLPPRSLSPDTPYGRAWSEFSRVAGLDTIP